jgi:hypothetical protein
MGSRETRGFTGTDGKVKERCGEALEIGATRIMTQIFGFEKLGEIGKAANIECHRFSGTGRVFNPTMNEWRV